MHFRKRREKAKMIRSHPIIPSLRVKPPRRRAPVHARHTERMGRRRERNGPPGVKVSGADSGA